MDYLRRFTKSQLLEILPTLPDTFTIEQIYDQLVFVPGVNKALGQVERGETYTTEEARELLRQMQQRDEP